MEAPELNLFVTSVRIVGTWGIIITINGQDLQIRYITYDDREGVGTKRCQVHKAMKPVKMESNSQLIFDRNDYLQFLGQAAKIVHIAV